jgi:hypothetical protein
MPAEKAKIARIEAAQEMNRVMTIVMNKSENKKIILEYLIKKVMGFCLVKIRNVESRLPGVCGERSNLIRLAALTLIMYSR